MVVLQANATQTGTPRQLLSLLQVVALLLPILAILLQAMIRLYSESDAIPVRSRRYSLVFVFAGVGFLLLAGIAIVSALALESSPVGIRSAVILTGASIVAIFLSVVTVVDDAIREHGGGPIRLNILSRLTNIERPSVGLNQQGLRQTVAAIIAPEGYELREASNEQESEDGGDDG